jgi:hypothetical protein
MRARRRATGGEGGEQGSKEKDSGQERHHEADLI